MATSTTFCSGTPGTTPRGATCMVGGDAEDRVGRAREPQWHRP